MSCNHTINIFVCLLMRYHSNEDNEFVDDYKTNISFEGKKETKIECKTGFLGMFVWIATKYKKPKAGQRGLFVQKTSKRRTLKIIIILILKQTVFYSGMSCCNSSPERKLYGPNLFRSSPIFSKGFKYNLFGLGV